MRKLILLCCAVLVFGLGLIAVGCGLGGELYSVYYDGALHPFDEAARDAAVTVGGHLADRTGLDFGAIRDLF